LTGQIVYVDETYGDFKAVAWDINTMDLDETVLIKGTWTEDGTITFGAWTGLADAGYVDPYEKSVLTKIPE
jgi:glucokinase